MRALILSIGSFFTHNEEGTLSNLEKIIFSLVIIVVAWVAIKIIIVLLRKLMGVKKANTIDRSAKIPSNTPAALCLLMIFAFDNMLLTIFNKYSR